jgi:beta-phosphoglucomutase-like phosphatase (HAD superfamily)
LVRGDTRGARSLARAALADPREDHAAARDLLRRTAPDPLALWLAAAVLAVLAAAALLTLFHGPGR